MNKARNAFLSLRGVWRSTIYSRRTKMKLQHNYKMDISVRLLRTYQKAGEETKSISPEVYEQDFKDIFADPCLKRRSTEENGVKKHSPGDS
jgi:hypothetical protein